MLNSEQIYQLIKEQNLIVGYPHLETQLNANGFDLTVVGIFSFDGVGSLDFSNSERVIPQTNEIKPQKQNQSDKYGWWELSKGTYKIKTNETITLPDNLSAFAFPRSSLLRMGVYTQTAFWDAGFSGKSEFLLVVENSKGVNIKENARLIQIAFLPIKQTQNLYNGVYKGLE